MTKRSRFRVASLPAATLLVAAAPLSAARADILASIQLDAERSVIRADGRGSTVISARVFDDRGNLVPDGTRVRFTTSAGRLDRSVVETQNGVARVTLYAADQPGEALVQAFLDAGGQASPARISITFSADAEVAETGTAWVQVSGPDYTGYAANSGVIQANGKEGKASLSYRRFTISADTIQFNVKTNEVLARGNVTLETGGGEGRKYNAVRVSLMLNQGVAERLNDDKIPIPYELRGPTFDETQFAAGRFPPPSETWALADLSGANLVVVSRSILIEPNRRLQFRRATFYVDGAKTISMPYHIMSLDQDSIFPEQVVGYGTQGISVDFPFYYDVRPSAVGTLYVRRSARVGESAYSIRSGFYLDMVQTYNGARNASGTVEVNGLTRTDWGVRFRHAQQLGTNTTGSTFVDLPDHRSLFVTTQATRAFKTFSLNGVLSGSRAPRTNLVYVTNPANPASPANPTNPTNNPITLPDPTVPQPGTLVQQSGVTGDMRAQVYAETYGRTFLNVKPVLYTVNASVARQSLFGPSGYANGVLHSESIGTRLYTVPLPVARQTTFAQSLTLGNAWSQASGQVNASARGITLLGTSALNRSIGSLGSVGLTYDYTQLPLGYGTGVGAATGKHRIGVTGFLGQGDSWGLQITGSRGLDVSQTTLYSNLLFRISGPWRGRATLTYSEFAGVGYQDMEYALIRRIAGRDFAIYYSTTSRRFQLDLTGARF